MSRINDLMEDNQEVKCMMNSVYKILLIKENDLIY